MGETKQVINDRFHPRTAVSEVEVTTCSWKTLDVHTHSTVSRMYCTYRIQRGHVQHMTELIGPAESRKQGRKLTLVIRRLFGFRKPVSKETRAPILFQHSQKKIGDWSSERLAAAKRLQPLDWHVKVHPSRLGKPYFAAHAMRCLDENRFCQLSSASAASECRCAAVAEGHGNPGMGWQRGTVQITAFLARSLAGNIDRLALALTWSCPQQLLGCTNNHPPNRTFPSGCSRFFERHRTGNPCLACLMDPPNPIG
jgi:hypothetical protein